MDRQQADELAEVIKHDAPWLASATVQLAEQEESDDQGQGSGHDRYVCWITGQGFQADIESFEQWGRLMEQLQAEWRKPDPFPELHLPEWARPCSEP